MAITNSSVPNIVDRIEMYFSNSKNAKMSPKMFIIPTLEDSQIDMLTLPV